MTIYVFKGIIWRKTKLKNISFIELYFHGEEKQIEVDKAFKIFLLLNCISVNNEEKRNENRQGFL